MEHFDLDKALQAQLHTPAPGPAPELDAALKAKLWQRQEQLDAEPDTRAVSLWWLPMVANFIVCGVPAVIFALPIMPLWAHLASFALAWRSPSSVCAWRTCAKPLPSICPNEPAKRRGFK